MAEQVVINTGPLIALSRIEALELVGQLPYQFFCPEEVRAGLAARPEDYRWCSLGYHVQAGNAGGLLSTDFGLRPFAEMSDAERLRFYRKFVYRVGSLATGKGVGIDEAILAAEERAGFEIGQLDRFRHRTRYFTDSGVIGTKEFVARCYQRFKTHFACRNEKRPRPIAGLEGVYSLKRLSEGI
jgi:hypothetical protein